MAARRQEEARRAATRQTAVRQAEILHETARWPEARHATTIRTATLLTERPTVMNDMQIHVAADSNIGLRRRANQDSFIIDDGVFLVCDGMGGGVGGQRASSAAVNRFETLASRFTMHWVMMLRGMMAASSGSISPESMAS